MKRDRSHARRPLRQGFTTGSAAAAAAKAATVALLGVASPPPPGTTVERTVADAALLGMSSPPQAEAAAGMSSSAIALEVDIPLPGGGRLTIPVAEVSKSGAAWVVKDAGDDPDATHGARIGCRVELLPQGPAGAVTVEGGSGVGRVTLPGLPVPPGQAAINPAPKQQIADAVREAFGLAGYCGAALATVMVENGEAIARHTLNPRLGILGGISILGTAGIVKPFSHEAWRATILSGLSVARAAGLTICAFSTGRRSERLLMARHPEIPPIAFAQAADFFAFSLKSAVELGFTDIVWGCYFGKLAKMAQGLEYTHAHAGETDFALLADLAAQAVRETLAGAAGSAAITVGPTVPGSTAEAQARTIAHAVAGANTARHALELVEPQTTRRAFAHLTAQRALQAARSFAGDGPRLRLVCFDFEEGVLSETEG